MYAALNTYCDIYLANTIADISYWKASGGGLGLMAEATAAMVMGKVAKAGSLREITGDEIKELRSKHGAMSSYHPGGDVSLE